VGDILTIFNEKVTKIDNLLSEFNNLSAKIKFTLELEERGRSNFLDVIITKSQKFDRNRYLQKVHNHRLYNPSRFLPPNSA
jgi:hypothetical protein